MAAQIFQRTQDEFKYSFDAPESRTNWLVTDTEDPTVVVSLIAANIPLFDAAGNPLVEVPCEHQGAGIWELRPYYGPQPPLNTGLTIWEIDTTGGREKRYQSLGTTYRQLPADTGSAPSGGNANTIDFHGVIGQNESGPEGVDVAIPKMSLVAKRKYANNLLPVGYVQQLEALTASINAAVFEITWWGQTLTFEAGECLFLGAVVTVATLHQLEIDHKFEASRDRLETNVPPNPVNLQGFSAPVSKPGWSYSWIAFQRGTTSSGSNTYRTQVPLQYQAEKVYPDGDFSVLIL